MDLFILCEKFKFYLGDCYNIYNQNGTGVTCPLCRQNLQIVPGLSAL
jgi:hypothetical protein